MQGIGIRWCKLAGWIMVFLWMPLISVWAAENLLVPEKLDHEEGLFYTVKKGDTLWDISQRFSDSPWLWHDLWRLNPHIVNPHEIEPGTRVRIHAQKGTQKMPLPPPPPLPTIPSPPQPEFVYYPGIDKVGFIQAQAIEPLGNIFMVKDDKEMVSLGDMVYIRTELDTPPFTVGTQYLVYEADGPIENKKLKIDYGTHHRPTGIAKITRLDHEYAIAKIVKSFRTIHVGNFLTHIVKHPQRIKVLRTAPKVEGRIIAGEGSEVLFGQDSIVFIDKGEEDGIRPGQRYSIYRKKDHVTRKSIIPTMGPVDAFLVKTFEMGKLVVLFTQSNTATAWITESSRSVGPADFFGVLD